MTDSPAFVQTQPNPPGPRGAPLRAPGTGALDLADLLQGAAAPAAGERCLLCEAGRLRFALPIAALRGVEGSLSLTPVPHAPPWVQGVTNVRGTVVGVVDLARYFDAGEVLPARSRFMICGAGNRLVAFAIVGVPRVVDVDPDTVAPTEGVAGRLGRYVTGMIPLHRSAVPLLDMARVLADRELVGG